MRSLVTSRKAAARLAAAVALLFSAASGASAQGRPSPQGDPHQSRSVFEASQEAQPPAMKPRPRMPRLAAPEDQGDTKLIATLTRVTVDGARMIEPERVADAYRPFIGRKVSQADLLKITADVTGLYRRAGYHLSRAIIPPQDLSAGHLRLLVVEGSVTELKVTGAGAERFGVPAMLAPLTAERPSRFATFERQLMLANDLAGVRITDTTLDEIGTGSGNFRLTVAVETWTIYAATGVDNLGSAAVGPWQSYATATVNSTLLPTDALTVSASAALQNPQELRMARR
jgi:hemolysin activation/secretion protein